MLRATIAAAGAVILYVLFLPLVAPEGATARTLHPNELWSAIGGQTTFEKRCCGLLTGCEIEKSCGDIQSGGFDCRLLGRDDENPDSNNDQTCEWSGNPDHECTEGAGTVVCRKRWRCKWEVDETGAFCVRDTDPQIPNNPTESNAPDSCTSNCT